MRKLSFLLCLLLLFPLASKAQTADSLRVNRLEIPVHSNGALIAPDTASAAAEFPVGDTTSPLFAGNLWIAGKTPKDSVATASPTYELLSGDPLMGHGPVADQYGSSFDQRYERVWRLDRDKLVKHDKNWWKSGYQTPPMISEWPAHGDSNNGEASKLAKFKDVNGNGSYEPSKGDRPIMRGDEAIYFISRDDGPNVGSSRPMGIEVHGMLYAWDCPDNPALNNAVLLHYEVINRSSTSYDSVMLGHWNDFDIGCANDDYVGSDVERGSFFAYNGDGKDEDCAGAKGYGKFPASLGVVFLKGPEADSNGIDDAFPGAGYASVNGTGFNDGVTDNERFGMQYSISFESGAGPRGDPQVPVEYNNYLMGRWRDSTPATYGGNGYMTGGDTTSIFFPWDSDPKDYATLGSSTGIWSEGSAGNAPGDRRMLGSSGPVSFEPGDTLKLDLAYVAAQDNSSPNDSVAPVLVMKERVDTLRKYFLDDAVPCSDGSFSSIQEPKTAFKAEVFPNPSQGRFKVQLQGKNRSYRYELYNIRGELIRRGEWKGSGGRELRIQDEGEGLYFLRIQSKADSKVMKLMKR